MSCPQMPLDMVNDGHFWPKMKIRFLYKNIFICNLEMSFDGFYLKGKTLFPSQIHARQCLQTVQVDNSSLITHTYLSLRQKGAETRGSRFPGLQPPKTPSSLTVSSSKENSDWRASRIRKRRPSSMSSWSATTPTLKWPSITSMESAS